MEIKITKLTRSHDEAIGEARDQFAFTKTNRTRGRITLILTEAENPKDLIAALKNAGARLPAEQHERELLANELIKSNPKIEVRYTAHAGWHNKGRSFIRATGAIGHKAETFGGVSPNPTGGWFPFTRPDGKR